MAPPRAGDTYTFLGVLDEESGNRVALGSPPGAIQPGTVCTVREVVDADEPGAHDDTEDSVVVEFDEATLVYDDAGAPGVGTMRRAWACGVAQFGDLFKKGAK